MSGRGGASAAAAADWSRLGSEGKDFLGKVGACHGWVCLLVSFMAVVVSCITLASLHYRGGTCGVFANQADTACTKRGR